MLERVPTAKGIICERLEVRQFWNKKYERKQNEEHFFVIKIPQKNLP